MQAQTTMKCELFFEVLEAIKKITNKKFKEGVERNSLLVVKLLIYLVYSDLTYMWHKIEPKKIM